MIGISINYTHTQILIQLSVCSGTLSGYWCCSTPKSSSWVLCSVWHYIVSDVWNEWNYWHCLHEQSKWVNIGMCVHIHEAIQWRHLNSLFLLPHTGCFRPFSVGQAVPGTEVKLDSPGPSRDGEICFRERERGIYGIFAWRMEDKRQHIWWKELATLRSINKDGKRESKVRREWVL